MVVVDPRHSETAILADEWLPIKPGTDLAFLLGMINVMVKEELYDKKFVAEKTVGFEQLEDEIVNYPPEWAEKVCEIPAKTIVRITREMARSKTQSPHPSGLSWRVWLPVSEQLSDRQGIGHCQQSSGEYQSGRRDLLSEISPVGRTSTQTSCTRASENVEGRMERECPGGYPLGSYGDGIAHAIPELALRGELKADLSITIIRFGPIRIPNG